MTREVRCRCGLRELEADVVRTRCVSGVGVRRLDDLKARVCDGKVEVGDPSGECDGAMSKGCGGKDAKKAVRRWGYLFF